MSTLREFLSALDQHGVRLWEDGEQLRCKAPQGVLTPALVKELSARKAEVLAFLREAGRRNEGAPEAGTLLPRAPSRERMPLSFAQQRLWFLDQLGSGATYNMPGRLKLHGPLDTGALERALQEIVARHEALRTTFQATGGDVFQVVGAAVPVPLSVIALQGLAPEAQRDEVARLMREEARRPFDLSRDSMLRASLLRLAEDEHLLLFTVHHIVSDAWSVTVFTRELLALHDAFARGAPSPLPPLPRQYGDFAAWQRSLDVGSSLAFWKRTLHRPLPLLELPLDAQPPAEQDHRGGQLTARLSTEVTTALRALARQEESTPFMVMLAAFQVLFHLLTGQDDIILGTPSIGRTQPETEGMIGLFINVLALRTDLSGNPPFRELLRRVRKVTLDAFAHQDAPFEKVVELIQPERRPGRDPVFEVMLNYVNTKDEVTPSSQLAISVPENEAPDALRALTLYVYEGKDALSLELVYQRALFRAERMECLLDQLIGLLAQVVASPEQRIGAYSLVTEASRAVLPDMGVELDAPPQVPIAEQLREWARKTPEQTAVEWAGERYSYAELWRAATQVARGLLGEGLRKGDAVAVYGARSFGMVASLFGVLLSGGLMLPVAENLPRLRREAMLRVGEAKFILDVGTGAAPEDRWSSDGRRVIGVDARSGAIGCAVDEARPLPEVSADDPAYILFTSGTTGDPKGILGVHRGVAHFLAWQRATFGVGPSDRCAQYAGLSFELVLRDVFLAPTSGATLCLPARDLELDGAGFLGWLVRERITLMHPVPSLALAWLQHAPEGYTCRTLRWTLFAGEPLTDTLVQQWRRFFLETSVANFYGPSETTMAKCWYLVPELPTPGIQPVGRPMPQTQALVLSAEGKRCGIGESGQIVIRTPFRTLGYLNPSQNERRFLPNPERDDPRDLLYYTGDRGRYRPDGALDILGRVDNEIKINGVRVQPEEIKALLDQHPAVSGSVVVVASHQAEKRLVAYVVPEKGHGMDAKELRHYLAQRLPAALIPAAFVSLEAIPVTTNGKVDHRALPAPAPIRAEGFAVPRNELERRMVQLWQELLGVHAVGIRDNFFEIGGHSLIAVHLMARIQQAYGQHLPLSALFAHPTIETLAARLTGTDEGAPWSPLVPIQPKGGRLPFFCVPGLGGNVLYLHRLAHALGPEQPFYGLQSVGMDGRATPHATLEEMAAAYLQAIKQVQPSGPYHLGGHSFGGQVAFEMAQQLRRAGEEVALLALFDSGPPFAADEDKPTADQAGVLGEMAAILGFMAGKEMRLAPEALRPLPAEERLIRFKQMMEAAGVLPTNTDMQQVRGWLSVFESNYRMTYTPRDPLPVRTVYFCAREQPAEVRAQRLQGWLRLLPMDVVDLGGSHSTIMNGPPVTSLAERLTALLQEASA
ncbi:Long-chain-fatty-acid--CoA ligase [Chondromyces apiculatus DSM 436]|uniref:Long-chain-fatty-acid--CoA ligase n=1 Tax=Chondromyces apiculatus DSM 436 TaxID=1192034 RepID=A0A017SVS2_9BACT|nr:non-ribosomal peptide synthetase [Chondromyces apiculatus]EYF01034.1 Long-chain-fatty-acid--CoA ligase [Chondromyces apiculatus DSM 436]